MQEIGGVQKQNFGSMVFLNHVGDDSAFYGFLSYMCLPSLFELSILKYSWINVMSADVNDVKIFIS
jgi:hypothetical protein